MRSLLMEIPEMAFDLFSKIFPEIYFSESSWKFNLLNFPFFNFHFFLNSTGHEFVLPYILRALLICLLSTWWKCFRLFWLFQVGSVGFDESFWKIYYLNFVTGTFWWSFSCLPLCSHSSISKPTLSPNQSQKLCPTVKNPKIHNP